MKERVTLGLLLLMACVATWLFIQNIQLNKKLEQTKQALDEAKIAPRLPAAIPANPSGVSPFDKPNSDPRAEDFVPAASKLLPTELYFETLTYDFGRITEGQKVSTTFKFKNIGPNPLLISSAIASCGCTVPTWSRKPIAAGEKGEMLVQFDSQGKRGEVSKTVDVTANTKPPLIMLTIKATVIPRDK